MLSGKGPAITTLFVLTLTLTFILIECGITSNRWKERPEEDDNDEPIDDEPPQVIVPTGRPKPNRDPYRCDHLVSFPDKKMEFVECCRSFPRGSFICPRFAPPGHVCGIPHPPDCCQICPPPTTTTTTTAKPKPVQEDEEEDDDDEEEE